MKFIYTIILSLLITGCTLKSPKLYKPATPPVLADGYSIADYISDKQKYFDATNSNDLVTAKLYRDRIINNMRWVVDNAYSEYKGGLGHLRATSGLAYDITESGLTGAAALTGSASMRTLLSTFLMGLENVNSSVDKRFYANVPATTFIAAMDAARIPFNNDLDKCLDQPVTSCSFEKARAELGRLYYAGTLQSALQFLDAAAQNSQGVK